MLDIRVLNSYNKRIKSDEILETYRLKRNDEIAMNLEYCEMESDLLEEQDIIERLNERDDFIYLSGIINDRIAHISDRIDELMARLDDAIDSLREESFFEAGELVRGDFFLKYIELACSHYQYDIWKSLFESGISLDIYNLIEPGIMDYISNMRNRLESMKDNIFYVDLECFSEGDLVRLKDFDDNFIAISLSGWFCPERGAVNEIYASWRENGETYTHGGIYISYGDYEMTEDGIPIPYVEDELIVNFKEINSMLETRVDNIYSKLEQLENQLIELEV